MDARLSKRGEIDLPMRRQHIADYLREMTRLSRERNLMSLAQLLERAEIEADLCARSCGSPVVRFLS